MSVDICDSVRSAYSTPLIIGIGIFTVPALRLELDFFFLLAPNNLRMTMVAMRLYVQGELARDQTEANVEI